MDANEYSRREFLRKFAMLSSASLLVGLNGGCGSSGSQDNRVLYGPLPAEFERPVVNSIYLTDSQSNRIPLQNNVNVPVQVVCLIDFSKSMNTTAPAAISFSDAAGNSVPVSTAWANDSTLVITPVSQLSFGTTYTLSLGNDAEDIFGNRIVLTADAGATFTTVGA